MKIALDAMGGDFAPSSNIDGAIRSVNAIDDIDIILVGDKAIIEKGLEGKSYPKDRITIKHASEVVHMHDESLVALRKKKDSSIKVAVELVKSGQADGIISAGHSGVTMATSFFVLGKAKGVDRPAIAATMPGLKGPFVVIDAGANVDCKPEHLLQFGYMGSAYFRAIYGSQSPKIGLLSIGEEDTKGNELTKETFRLLKETDLNFIGNMEGKDVFTGVADVIVCDGFIGNVVLKLSEGLAEAIIKMLKNEISSPLSKIMNYIFTKPAVMRLKRKTDYDEMGGAPLLGINGSCIVCHGRSSAKAIGNALNVANQLTKIRLDKLISDDFSAYGKKLVKNKSEK
ncbi:MAG: phosphate acyltransferase PlsX [Nitrospirae bacterium]|nr:phosphate acyltransferase PlsX [Nitrospirota bacterium]MBF0542469.1 phosphate acyltransferase PlsX [Nitrospirota bacterium]